MYLGPPCYGFALNCHLVYLALPGTVMYEKAKICLFYLYATAKSEIQICSNKHETGLVSFFQRQCVKSYLKLMKKCKKTPKKHNILLNLCDR